MLYELYIRINYLRSHDRLCLFLSMGKWGKGKAIVHAFGTEAIFSELSYTYPLKLISPKLPSSGTYPTAVAYILSYGGGLVPGDRIEVELEVGKGAALVILTQVNIYKFSPCPFPYF